MNKFKPYWIIITLSAAILSACGTPRPVVLAPDPIARSKPIEAIEPCPDELPTLPDTLPDMQKDEALRTILATKISSDEVYRDCAARQKALADWIIDE